MSRSIPIAVAVVLASFIAFRVSLVIPFIRDAWSIFCVMFMENQFLQGMLVPGFLSIASYGLWKFYLQLDTYLRTHLLRSITIKKQDDNYDTVVSYITKKYVVDSQAFIAETFKNKKKTWKEWREEFMTGKTVKPRFTFRPSDNSGAISFFKYNDHRIMMVRTKGNTVTVGHDRQPLVLEELTLTCWGKDSSILIDILNEALDDQELEESDELNIWVLAESSWIGGWEKALSKRPRAKESVILDHNLADSLIEDARKFQNSAEWYGERGIPYRRGYILHGPPGTGKTSFCQVLAAQLRLDMCMLNLADGNLTDSKLASSLREAPKKSIIMIEDIDSVFVERHKTNNHDAGGVTFSGLLNAIDGIASQEGRILIMTTNHIDRLDPALIRPGRCDVIAELTHASKQQAKQLFTRFFPDAQPHLAHDFMSRVPQYEVSMAALQGHLLRYRDEPIDAVDKIDGILKLKHQGAAYDDEISVFDHLRRVGLERYSYALEAYGYFKKQDMINLTIEKVQSWIVELKYDEITSSRFEKLLSKDSELMRKYMMCDIPTIKEMYNQFISKQGSDSVPENDRKRWLEELIRILVPEGKGLASIWQLNRHMTYLCADYSPEIMTKKAYLLVEPRSAMTRKAVVALDEPEVNAIKDCWMTAYQWCRRSGVDGFDACAQNLEKKGYVLARDFMHFTEDKDIADIGFGAKHSKIAKLLIDNNISNGRSHLLENFKLLEFQHAKQEFLNHYGESQVSQALLFAQIITDRLGFGLISLGDCKLYFKRCIDGKKSINQVIEDAEKELISVQRKPMTEPLAEPERTDWVVNWLKEAKLESYISSFIGQEILTQEDVLKPHPITEEQLIDIGVKKLGHRKKLLSMIQGLE